MQIKIFCSTSAVALLALGFTGCASIVDGGDRKVSIRSEPTDARVTVFNRAGEEIAREQTPTVLALKRGSGYFKGAKYRLLIEKAGFQPSEIALNATVNGWYFGNFAFGGLIGFLAVDPATGAMWTLEPKDVNVVLQQSTASFRKEPDGLVVMLRRDVPAEFNSRLILVN